MTKQVFIIEYNYYDEDALQGSTCTSGYFDSKEDAEKYLDFHGYVWNNIHSEYTHPIYTDHPRVVELEKVDMNLTRPEVDTFLYEQLGASVEVEYIGTLAQVKVSEFELYGLTVNKSKFIHSHYFDNFFNIEKAALIAHRIKDKVNTNLGEFSIELSFEDDYVGANDFRWIIIVTNSDGDVIYWLDTRYYTEDSVDIFVNEIEYQLRDNLPLNPQVSPMSRKQILDIAYEEAVKVFGVDPAYFGEEGEEEINRQLEKLGYKAEDFQQ